MARNGVYISKLAVVESAILEEIFDAAREIGFVLVESEYRRVFLDDVERDGHDETDLGEFYSDLTR